MGYHKSRFGANQVKNAATLFLVVLLCTNQYGQKNVIDCSILDTLFNEINLHRTLEATDTLKDYFIYVRIIDKHKQLKCMADLDQSGNRIRLLRSEQVPYSFNTGICREVVMDKIRKVEKDKFVVTFLLYPYYCAGSPPMQVRCINYYIKKSRKPGINIISRSHGDVTLKFN